MKLVQKSTSQFYIEHVEKLLAIAERDDGSEQVLDARRSLACLSLLAEGWNYGDPDPTDGGPDGDGGEPVPVERQHIRNVGILLKRAA